MAKTAVVSLRIEADLQRKMSDFVQSRKDISQSKFVENLIEYFFSQDDDFQESILSKKALDTLTTISKSIEFMEFGAHAHQYKLWVWATENFARLEEIAKDTPSLRRFAHFKLASCWMDLAASLRNEAMLAEDDRENHMQYDIAIDCLRVAIAYLKAFNTAGDNPAYPPAKYNEACAWCLLAKYFSERGADENEKRLLREKTKIGNEKKESESPQNIHESEKLPIAIARKALDNSIACLKEINSPTSVQGGEGAKPPYDMRWIASFAETDTDLDFLRERDKDFFPSWIRGIGSENTLMSSVIKLRKNVPWYIEEIIQESDIPK